jgi:lipopolysaccharide/colanic/teichoic acid biosynthesis glycosyltransferase
MIKRLFDLVVSGIGLVLFAPVLLLVALLIKLDSPGTVFYKGDRVGKDGVPFKILKLRTMALHADRMGPALTRGQDPRVTRTGQVLRRWKIDELPQLINVLRGEMSLVGPRPESPGYVQHYTEAQRKVLEVKPGITGLTQVKYRNEEALLRHCTDLEGEYLAVIMPRKLALDLEYIRQRSLPLDLVLIGKTLACLFSREECPEPGALATQAEGFDMGSASAERKPGSAGRRE